MSLRLVWAGPWNGRSSIALFGTEVVRELAKQGHDVEVLRTEVGHESELPSLPAPGLVLPVGEKPIADLVRDFDGIIVNLGNHYAFHGGALPILRETAPLVILHDAWMGHFVQEWRNTLSDGERDAEHLFAGLDDDPSGIGPLCSLASGVVIHGPHYRAEVEAACPGPVTFIPLAHTLDALPAPRVIGDRLIVTTIGYVNKNKRAEEVIRALGASERLKSCVLYMLVGSVEPAERARLVALASRVGAPEPYFTGWVPDDVLRTLMTGTDVFCCLRYPALEGGSGTVIFSMLSARPTLVSNHASYAEIPDGLVMKCSPGKEAAYVMHYLERILDDPEAARTMGARAREYALEHFSPEKYVVALVRALDEATQKLPAIWTARAIGKELGQFGVRSDDPVVDRMDAALVELFGGKESHAQ